MPIFQVPTEEPENASGWRQVTDIDGVDYVFVFDWIDATRTWSITIASDTTEAPDGVIVALRPVRSSLFLIGNTHPERPLGDFIVTSRAEAPGAAEFNEGSAQLLYFTGAELDSLRETLGYI